MGFSVTPQVPIVDGSFVAVVDFLVEDCVGGRVRRVRQVRPATGLCDEVTPADIVFAEKVREDHVRELGHEMVRG